MPLLRIEVSDFKSYRGHQTIGPFSQFTSVIGPNGAGKSNLMDAISFVLGIRSAVLRSSQLKDLVYRGRRLERSKDGVEPGEGEVLQEEEEENEGEGDEVDAKTAWVMAIYEDADKKEWRFQRTISTTGSSEYKINGQTISAQAYTTALAKHNILTKAKNFLVFQGDVEHIASQSPKDLSKLIDQISGSLELAGEYERAKKALDKATENATDSFHKKRGLAGEMKVFKEQMTEAERFESMVSERDNLILSRHLWKLYHIEQKIEENSSDIVAQNQKLNGLRKEQAAHNERLDAARAQQAQARKELTIAEKKVKTAEKALEAKKPDLVAVEGRIAHERRKLNNNENLYGTVSKDVQKQQDKLATYRRDLAAVHKAADAAQKAAREASSSSITLDEGTLEEYRRLKAQANVQAVDERQSVQTLTRDEKTSKRALESLREAQRDAEEKKAALDTEAEALQERKEELENKLAGLQNDLSRTKQELNSQASEYARISQLETETNEKLQDCHEKLLSAGLDKRESEKDAKLKETLASLQRLFPGVRGRIVDLCKPTQRKYETAVSVVLGRNIDAVVVDQEKTAIECIEYMRSHRAGQATFIPLDTIQVKPINDKYRNFAKGARLAVDVIQYEPAVERAMHHACGNALVCDTMEIARHVCYDKNQEVKAVTLEGTIIHKSGLITGGRSTHGGGKKWDEKDLQGLYRVRDALLVQMRDLAKSKPRTKSDENLVAEMTRLESAITLIKDDLAGDSSRLEGLKEELKHLRSEIKKNAPKLKQAEAAYSKLVDQIGALSSVVNKAEDTVFSGFCRKIGVANIREYEQRQLKAAQEEGESRLKFDTQIARLTHQSEFEEEQLKATQERLVNLQNANHALREAIARHEAEKTRIEEDMENAEAEIATLQETAEELKQVLDAKTKELNTVKKSNAEATKVLDQALKDIASKNDEIEKLASERASIYRKCRLEEIDLPLVQGNLKNVPMEENLREDMVMDVDDEDGTQRPRRVNDYGIEVNFESLTEEEQEDGSGEAGAHFDTAIAKLNGEIERMAPNMKAMERFDDVEARLVETEKEAEKARKDSKKARDEFHELRRRRCELFNKAFDHISERIDQIYKDLTKGKASPQGGVAYLSLEDSDEPYVGGIKYHAMPPMKRFRDMDQLSGGEKTVAALALLFAIHSFHPSPFFVLDEVDAALDNTNVAKLANYIRGQASPTFQFIVISLKGSLYERGNSLVGIYRDQEVNSSRSLTLDLTQYDD